jgi:hypothetical protein
MVLFHVPQSDYRVGSDCPLPQLAPLLALVLSLRLSPGNDPYTMFYDKPVNRPSEDCKSSYLRLANQFVPSVQWNV